ncbi:hypothetical protein BsWGS_01784 [Bradybaena similaris]
MRNSDDLPFLCFLISSVFTICVRTFNVDTDNPIVFKGPRNSFFGYSVAILENSQGTWLLVGAPRANDSALPGVYQPGAMFQCNWQYRSSCQHVFIDDVGNEKQIITKWKNVTVQHSKDNQWMGASVDVNVHGDSQVMVCAPRWIDKKFEVQGIQLMNGLCYESSRDLDFDESSAYPALENWKKQVHGAGYFSYGMGSLGISISYSKDGRFSVLGAPGLNDWAGGFVYAEGDTTKRPKIMELSADTDSSSYFGMAITTARLSADGVHTIIGGPRAGGFGKVYAYNDEFQLLFAKEGNQIGSSFGAALCAVDLNGDSLDELVVGAPFFSDVLDEGRVYVYMNREFFNLELTETLIGSNIPGSRFGSAIANVGDLNLDHYEDIAVGAPYEEDSGVVYIYNGARHGLRQEPSQRIVGKSLSKGLKSFGSSFSQPWDVDGNHYGDFAVGSYESDRVVLLRARPVFNLYASLETNPTIIDQSGKSNCVYRGLLWHCLEVSVCLRYTGQNLPPSAELNITLRLDVLERHRGERPRLFFLAEDDAEIEKTSDLVTSRLDRVSCLKKYTVYTRKAKDIVTPILIELEFNIASNSLEMPSMSVSEPIRNKYNPNLVNSLIIFALNCGEDHICNPSLDIKTTAIFDSGGTYLIVDDSPSFELEIIVSNSGEISHLTVVSIEYPSTVDYSSVTVIEGTTSINCASEPERTDNATLNCDLMSPVTSKDKVVLRARFYTYGTPYNIHKLEVKTKVKSVGPSMNTSRSEMENVLTIPVKMRTEIKFSGVSIPGLLAVPQEMTILHEEDVWSHLSHIYILHNLGPSPMPHGQLTLTIPAQKWLKLNNVQIETRGVTSDFSHIPVECSMPADRNETHNSQTYGNSKLKYGDDFIYSINCDLETCFNVTCYVGLLHKFETVYINVSLAIKTNILQVLKVYDKLGVMTSGLLREPDYTSYNSLTPGISTMTTTYIVYKSTSGLGITWWLLVISISSGLLLLYILTVLLWKCGFFRRKKREALQQLITSSDTERDILHSDSFSADSGDIMIPPLGHISHMANHNIHNSDLFVYRHLEPHQQTNGHSFQNHDFFQNHSLNRRDVNHGFSHVSSFHTLQCSNRNLRNMNPSRDSYRNERQHDGNNPVDANQNDNPHKNIWTPPPPAPSSPPSFNNDMYLEPLESRA